MEKRVIVAGTGGQGILTGGQVLALAIAASGYEVSWAPVYGAEQRGGVAYCSVVMSTDFVSNPIVEKPDLAVLASEGALKTWSGRIKDGGSLIYDAGLTDTVDRLLISPMVEKYAVPALRIANEKCGSERFMVMIMIGAAIGKIGGIDVGCLSDVLNTIFKDGSPELLRLNFLSLQEGMAAIG
ncbi:MAG: 2-oxoacid:acceptor oxidoreductase family protein [Thermoanaerobacteraceae bacterium]|nr:2-oxoacid:acceptor oxidoreductase family protein [Thermoanaerobacteraceae bacterium]